jgi:hypothetical protein
MPILKPSEGQTEEEFVPECVAEIINEYGEAMAAYICYSIYRES